MSYTNRAWPSRRALNYYSMFTKSATPATPVPKPISQINESTSWVKDWFSPLEYDPNVSANCKLKGWVKIAGGHGETARKIGPDTIDLEKFKYLDEPVVARADEVQAEPAEGANGDLKLALSMDKKDDQISSLSGLGM